jgi:hypothetical protein
MAGGFWGGTGPSIQTAPTVTRGAGQGIDQLLQMGLQGLKNPTQGFDPIEQRARSQFQQNTVPSLAERFSSMGKNSLSSGAFATQVGQAGAGLEEALAAMRAQYGLQSQGQNLNLAQLGLTPQFQNYQMQGQPGFLQNSLGTVTDAATRALMGYFTGGGSELSNILRLLGGYVGGGSGGGSTFGNTNFPQQFGQMSQNSY